MQYCIVQNAGKDVDVEMDVRQIVMDRVRSEYIRGSIGVGHVEDKVM